VVRIQAHIRETVDDYRQDAEALPEPVEVYTIRLDRAVQALTVFLDRPQAGHLPEDQREQVVQLRTDLEEERAYVEGKAEFDRLLGESRTALEDLETATADHLDMETYLTTPQRTGLQEQIERVRGPFNEIEDEELRETVSAADIERFKKCRSAVGDIETHIETYNEQFVEQECEVLDQFGPADQSLNERQRRAVVRDEQHNRVIAGPGTGKTFSLLARIAYLVEKDVPPEEILVLSYGRLSREELDDRLSDQFDVSDIEVRTLHSYGKNVVDRVSPDTVWLLGETRLREVNELLGDLRETDADVARHYDEFLDLYRADSFSNDQEDWKNLYNSLKFNKAKTLQGEEVDPGDRESRTAVTTIADTLFEYRVDYQYRKYAPWAEPADGDPYIPDFTLPDHNVCIEYIPSKDANSKRKWYDRKRSARSIEQFYDGTDRTVLTIHGADISTGNIDKMLRFKLEDAGVSIAPHSVRTRSSRRRTSTIPSGERSSSRSASSSRGRKLIRWSQRLRSKNWTRRKIRLSITSVMSQRPCLRRTGGSTTSTAHTIMPTWCWEPRRYSNTVTPTTRWRSSTSSSTSFRISISDE